MLAIRVSMFRRARARKSAAQETACVHFWEIEPAVGPVSKGVCRRCGAVREFRNFFPLHPWEEEGGLEEVSLAAELGPDFHLEEDPVEEADRN